MDKHVGTVVWFDSRKGYGFVKNNETGNDVFVHFSNIQIEGYKSLEAGQSVEFEMGTNHRGPQCVNVRLVQNA